MKDIINIKDFYDHETRISIVENAIISIDRRFEQVDKRFEQVDKRFDKLEAQIHSQFKWIMGAFGGLALSAIGILVTLILKLH